MSIPLPSIHHRFEDNDEETNIDCAEVVTGHKININDLFLDAEERYEIFQVKAAERPHLLNYDEEMASSSNSNDTYAHCHETKNGSEDDKINYDDDHEKESKMDPPPLIDGCDVPGWRKEQLVSFPNKRKQMVIQSLLNIGPSSTMFRRESQWPNIHKILELDNAKSKWNVLKSKLSDDPSEADRALIVGYEDYHQMVEIIRSDDCQQMMMATKFALEFEQPNIPAKIMGATNDWKCMPKKTNTKTNVDDRAWTFENLVKRFGNINWRFSDTHGEMMSLRTYAKYIHSVEGLLDDSPLGIYDAEFGDDGSPTCELINEYEVPKCFSPDVFDLASNHLPNHAANNNNNNEDDDLDKEGDLGEIRPPWRWILIGPERSGTGLHIDPLWTNAWVTVIQGKKRWLLFPPSTPKDQIGMGNGPQINSATWFHTFYDKVTSDDWPSDYKPVEVLQLPGETVFVPNGWPHIVLNLETTVAITHNYASEFGPFERMWEEVAQDEPEFAERWLDGMKNERPDLYQRVKM